MVHEMLSDLSREHFVSVSEHSPYRHHLHEFWMRKGRERKKNDMSGVKNDDRHNYSKNYEPLRCWSYARGNSARNSTHRGWEQKQRLCTPIRPRREILVLSHVFKRNLIKQCERQITWRNIYFRSPVKPQRGDFSLKKFCSPRNWNFTLFPGVFRAECVKNRFSDVSKRFVREKMTIC